jgi:hypothetical protein
MNDIEIESLFFKQIKKPKHFLMIRIINIFENRYRINVYTEIEEDTLIKRRISSSHFCHYTTGKLTIIPDIDYRPSDQKKKR